MMMDRTGSWPYNSHVECRGGAMVCDVQCAISVSTTWDAVGTNREWAIGCLLSVVGCRLSAIGIIRRQVVVVLLDHMKKKKWWWWIQVQVLPSCCSSYSICSLCARPRTRWLMILNIIFIGDTIPVQLCHFSHVTCYMLHVSVDAAGWMVDDRLIDNNDWYFPPHF